MRKLLLSIALIATSMLASAQIIPHSIHPGSRIAIVSPSSSIDSKWVLQCADTLKARGYEPVIMPHALGKNWGSYPASDQEKLEDLTAAFADSTIDVILCSRGGYSSTRLLPKLDEELIRNNPKWLIGFSDISALHALMAKAGVASIHGPMAKPISNPGPQEESVAYLFQILEQGLPLTYTLENHEYNKLGTAKGRLLGGNFIVVNNLAETPWDVINRGYEEDVILFVEEVGEKIYAVERMLLRLHQSGALGRVKGIVFGEFTEYTPDENFETMEDMIHYWLNEWGYYDDGSQMPILYGFPSGHDDDINWPLVLGANCTLAIDGERATLTFE